MSIRAFVDGGMILSKPRGNIRVEVETSWHSAWSEDIVSLTFFDCGKEKSVWIGGPDVMRMLRAMSRDPRYQKLFNPLFVKENTGPMPTEMQD